MKTQFIHWHLAISVLILLAIGTNAHAKNQGAVGSHGHAIFTPTNSTDLDFSSVRTEQTKQRTFAFTNTGDDTLFLQSLELSTDTGFTIQFARLTIAPGQSGTVVVQFEPTKVRRYDATLSFTVANGVTSPTLTLHGRGIGLEEAAISGATLLSSGDVNRATVNRAKQAH